MSNSSLIDCTIISPNKNSPRNHAIDTITIHCVVGQCSAERIGEIFKYGDYYYEVIAPHTSNVAAYPVETTFAYYRHIEISASGTIDDPIPYPEGAGIVVNVEAGKYYSYKGEVYLATSDMPNCVYPPDTAGMWQWEKVESEGS